MKVEYNLSITEIILRHITGMMLGIVGGFLGYYVSPAFLIIAAFAPLMIVTAILGWCPLKSLTNTAA